MTSCAIITKSSAETLRHAPLAQLDRASGYGPEGREFESLTACQKTCIVRCRSFCFPRFGSFIKKNCSRISGCSFLLRNRNQITKHNKTRIVIIERAGGKRYDVVGGIINGGVKCRLGDAFIDNGIRRRSAIDIVS